VQKHAYTKTYYLRKEKATSDFKYRFNYPTVLRIEVVIAIPLNRMFLRFLFTRNDDRLNNYNRLINIS